QDDAVLPLSADFLKDHQKALRLARRQQIQIVFVVMDFKVGEAGEITKGVRLYGRPELIRSEKHRDSFLQNALLPVLRQAAGENVTAAYILVNEPDNLLRAGLVSQDEMSTYVRKAAELVKKNAPNQPVAIGSKDLEGLMHFANRPEVDFLVMHHYEQHL